MARYPRKKADVARVKGKYGRNPLPDKKLKNYYYGFRLDAADNERFEKLVAKSGAKTKTEFIQAAIFGRTIRTVTTDMEKHNFIIELSQLHRQYQAIGNNYNQVVRHLKTVFDERKALQLLYRLEQETINLVKVNREIVELSQKLIDENERVRKIEPSQGNG